MSRLFHWRAAQYESALAEAANYSPVKTKVNHFLARHMKYRMCPVESGASSQAVDEVSVSARLASLAFPIAPKISIDSIMSIIATLFLQSDPVEPRRGRMTVPHPVQSA